MIRFFLVFGLFIFSTPLLSQEFAIKAKKQGHIPITKFSIFSERCSGSNYLEQLILLNLEIESGKFCHKHFPPWFDLPLEKYHGDPRHYTFEETDDFLFFVIFRNPYDWVRSFFRKPWHGSDELFHMSFSKFIRTPWTLNPQETVVQTEIVFNPLMDRPSNGSYFRNVFELRSAKIRNMLEIGNKASNVYIINYEIARDHPEEVLAEISKIYSLKAKPVYTPVIYYYGDKNQGIYENKQYKPISKADLKYINSKLDETLEEQIGYETVKKVKKLTSEES